MNKLVEIREFYFFKKFNLKFKILFLKMRIIFVKFSECISRISKAPNEIFSNNDYSEWINIYLICYAINNTTNMDTYN